MSMLPGTTTDALEALLTVPSDRLVEDLASTSGDIVVLGAGGKMGPSLAVLAPCSPGERLTRQGSANGGSSRSHAGQTKSWRIGFAEPE